MWVTPNMLDDMHDGPLSTGDTWLSQQIPQIQATAWYRAGGVIVLTWDEGFDSSNNIPTLFYGPMIKPGAYEEPIDHYTVLRTIEDLLQLPPTGAAAHKSAISDCWR